MQQLVKIAKMNAQGFPHRIGLLAYFLQQGVVGSVLLNRVAALYESGTLVPIVNQALHGLSAETIKQAHTQLESGTTIGKLIVVV